MSNRSQLPLAAATVTLLLGLAACDGPLSPEVGHTTAAAVASGEPALATDVLTPFRATFFTAGSGLAPDPACGEAPRLLNVQAGEGTSSHLGRFTVRITFCMDVTDVLDDGQITAGESLPYDNGRGTLVAANGDELHIEISGAVVPSSDPDYDLEFHDHFRITGGTGRFAGAYGEGVTESFVDQSADRTDHAWSGLLGLSRDARPTRKPIIRRKGK